MPIAELQNPASQASKHSRRRKNKALHTPEGAERDMVPDPQNTGQPEAQGRRKWL
jgi:hypothetical protein